MKPHKGPGGGLKTKMLAYQYGKSHKNYKKVSWQSIFIMEIPIPEVFIEMVPYCYNPCPS